VTSASFTNQTLTQIELFAKQHERQASRAFLSRAVGAVTAGAATPSCYHYDVIERSILAFSSRYSGG
jgi:hypothetical protein